VFNRLAVVALLATLLGGPSWAEEIREGDYPTLFHRLWERGVSVFRDGGQDIYLSGYHYHGRRTYSEEKLARINERAWGAGLGRTALTPSGNRESVYAILQLDSFEHLQGLAGYAYFWRWNVASKLSLGAGATGLLLSRRDTSVYLPVPLVLPAATLDLGPVSIVASYLPPIPGRKEFADVLTVVLRISLAGDPVLPEPGSRRPPQARTLPSARAPSSPTMDGGGDLRPVAWRIGGAVLPESRPWNP
jgi:palmitoyl transferase